MSRRRNRFPRLTGLAATAALFLSLAAAQIQVPPAMPSCAFSCLGKAAQATGCYPDDLACLCASGSFKADGEPYASCVDGSCSKSPSQIQTAKEYITYYCNIVGNTKGSPSLPFPTSGGVPTTSSTATVLDTSGKDGSQVLTAGVIAGIVVGAVAFLVLVGSVAWIVLRQKRKARTAALQSVEASQVGLQSPPELGGKPSARVTYVGPRELPTPNSTHEIPGEELRHEVLGKELRSELP